MVLVDLRVRAVERLDRVGQRRLSSPWLRIGIADGMVRFVRYGRAGSQNDRLRREVSDGEWRHAQHISMRAPVPPQAVLVDLSSECAPWSDSIAPASDECPRRRETQHATAAPDRLVTPTAVRD